MPAAYDDRLELDVPTIQPFMDGATQKIRDFSGKARHGVPSGFAGTDVEYEDVNGLGQCVSISNPKYIDHGQVLNYTVENFSFEFVFNANTLAGNPVIINKGTTNVSGYIIELLTTGQIQLITNQAAANQTSVSATSLFTTGQYQHAIISRNGASVKFYRNGIETGYAASPSHINPTSSADNLWIGAYIGPSTFLNGRVLRYRSWSRAIGAAEAAERYQAWVMGK